MSCGVYGKLPCKRDFVAERVPRDFLRVIEPWLQGSISSSRLSLGRRWQEIYGSAPIWRFWFGPAICGASVVGAMMPSSDGVGRAFPLVAMSAAPAGQTFQRPEIDPMEGFFGPLEDLLLSALDRSCDYDALLDALAALAPSAPIARKAPEPGVTALGDGLAVAAGRDSTEPPFDRLGAARGFAWDEHAVFWWTLGGAETPPTVASGLRLPQPDDFVRFLTCNFESQAVSGT